MSERRLIWLVAIAYLVIAFVLYAPVLNAFFLADDFAYLDAIKTTGSPSVMFTALAGRYFRPMAMFVYYANYQISGLAPTSYHVTMLLVHVVNTWLVFLLGRQLAPQRHIVLPALAGLLFLVFGGHAEAISWISGMADPLVTMFLLTSVLCFMHVLDSPQPLPWALGVWLAFAGALLSKESSAIFPGLAALAFLFRVGWPTPAHLRRAALALLPLVVIGVAYLAFRRHVLGFTLVTLEGLGQSQSILTSARSFFLRSFLPQGPLTLWFWNHDLDALGWLVVAGGFVWGLIRAEYRALAFLTACLFVALAPVLPLSIGIATTDSERLIYLPSAFACLLVVWTIDALLRKPSLVTVATLLFCWWHVVELRGQNRLWKAAGDMSEEMTASFGPIVREHWRPGQPIFLMGLPDNLRNKFTWRRGFHEGLRVTNPDTADAVARTYVMSILDVADVDAHADVRQLTPNTFELQLTNITINPSGRPSSNAYYTVHEVGATRYIAEFTPMAGRGLLMYFTPRKTALAARIPTSVVPFGHIDLPAGAVTCNGTNPSLAGWALDDEGIARVVIGIARTDAPESLVEVGEAQRPAPRPDVTALFPALPDSAAPGWTFTFPCLTAKAKTHQGSMQVVVIAENRRGQKTRLGALPLVMN
jgi:hypothetical protein